MAIIYTTKHGSKVAGEGGVGKNCGQGADCYRKEYQGLQEPWQLKDFCGSGACLKKQDHNHLIFKLAEPNFKITADVIENLENIQCTEMGKLPL